MKIISRINKSKSISNMIWLSSDSIIRLGLGFIISVWLARYLGPDDFGLYNYAYAMIAIYSAIASLGMNGVVVRELVKADTEKNVLLGTSFFLQIIGSLIASVFVISTTMILRPHEWNLVLIVLVMLPSVLIRSSDVVKYFFESVVSAKYTVISQNIAFVISSLLKILIIVNNGSYLMIGFTVTIEALITAFLLFYFYKLKHKEFNWKVDFQEAKRLLSLSWPLIISGVALMLYMRIDQVMIGNMIGNAAVGIYSVAVKMVEVWYFIPVAIVSSVFPKIIKIKEVSELQYNERLQLLYDVLVVVSVSLAIFVSLFADYIISFFYDIQYIESSRLIKMYSWVCIFYFLSSASGRWYINEGLQKYALNRNLIGLLIGIFLNYILIPKYGMDGSVYATLIAYFCAGYLFDVFSHKTRLAFYQKTKSLWLPGAILRIKKTISR
ncbi:MULTISPECIES: flippase [Rahnella]|uniref:flippase n=1 Tax=Rahnella TaxID=34037 RepID=UPI001F539949|nr:MULTISPECIES: flippase [Rahnella]MCM2447749.1 flippase [Rahnella sp. CG8]UNK53157.1 flippase [Rahnella aceris]